jgi:hypothetical protein
LAHPLTSALKPGQRDQARECDRTSELMFTILLGAAAAAGWTMTDVCAARLRDLMVCQIGAVRIFSGANGRSSAETVRTL